MGDGFLHLLAIVLFLGVLQVTSECDGLAVCENLFLACGFSVREEEITLGDSNNRFLLAYHYYSRGISISLLTISVKLIRGIKSLFNPAISVFAY